LWKLFEAPQYDAVAPRFAGSQVPPIPPTQPRAFLSFTKSYKSLATLDGYIYTSPPEMVCNGSLWGLLGVSCFGDCGAASGNSKTKGEHLTAYGRA
jgi:hypothetical protein